MSRGWICILFLFSACVRDNICTCIKKVGCKHIYVIKNSNSSVIAKERYCPLNDFDNDPGFSTFFNSVKQKYDAIGAGSGELYSTIAVDSFKLDSIKDIPGAVMSGYRDKKYFCRCHD